MDVWIFPSHVTLTPLLWRISNTSGKSVLMRISVRLSGVDEEGDSIGRMSFLSCWLSGRRHEGGTIELRKKLARRRQD